ncbi:MAG: FAD-dependent oxidoreductase [Cyanobacteria bacterium CRU_2_1]|nr:FAD-dependent oxidoreductase [Cyanobacteria bacterium CRU_2_1]
MTILSRAPAAATTPVYDLVIVGGGIYGAMLCLAAARRGLQPLLLERHDFGGATSLNSLRIVHGGLRYLQTLDLQRFFESTGERQWLLKTFPDLVEPLPCLMPLYGNGSRRPLILQAALTLNATLAFDRNHGVRADRYLPAGGVVSAEQVRRRFPLVDPQGLKAGAIWYDGSLSHSQRLVMAVLRWAANLGATALNYMTAQDLLKQGDRVVGVLAQDTIDGQTYEYQAKAIVNAAGPWCREFAAQVDRDLPQLFESSIAWNALFDRPALSDHAVAVAPKQPNARTYFIRPWQGRLLAGTVHDPWTQPVTATPMPSPQQLTDCLNDLNQAIPGLDLKPSEIVRIFSGLLPAKQPGTAELSVREILLDHHQHGGPKGLYSVSGVKFTTSHLVAEKTVSAIFPAVPKPRTNEEAPAEVQRQRGIFDFNWYPTSGETDWKTELQTIVQEEAVQYLDDLVLRRTSLGDNPDRAMAIAALICELFDWDEHRCKQEIFRLATYFHPRRPASLEPSAPS